MPTMEQTHCSQCNEVGPLLACDDSERGDKAISKPRFCNNCMLGKKVKVFWPVDESWYTGVVQEYNDKTGEHLLQYPDGDTEWVKIGDIMQAAADAGGAPQVPQGIDSLIPLPPRIESMSPPVPPSFKHDAHSMPEETRKWPGEMGPYSYAPPGPYPPPPPHMHGPPPPQSGYPPVASMTYGGALPPQHMPQHYGMYPPPSAGYGGPMYPPSYGAAAPIHHPAESMHKPAADSSPPETGRRKTGPKPWPKEEDALLMNLVHSMQYPIKWTVIAQSLHGRTGKQCRERYVNHLNPRLKNTDWTPVEDSTIFHLYNTIGSHWAKMSKVIPGRTDNNIKNRFHNIRRQYEREDTHRMRLSAVEDFPDEIRLDRLRKFPDHLAGKATDLWDMKSAVGVLAAQSVLGDSNTNRNMSRFGPFTTATGTEICVRCGFCIPSVHTGTEVCSKTGWCQSCARVPPNVSGNLLRECLNLRRTDDKELKAIIESWEELVAPDAATADVLAKKAKGDATEEPAKEVAADAVAATTEI